MAKKTLVFLVSLMFANLAFAAVPDMKAISCMFELEAEAYRFARLQLELSQSLTKPALVAKLRAQIKASTHELFLNLHEAKPGLGSAGMQNQYKRLEDAVGDYVADAISTPDSQNLASLGQKQAMLIKLAADFEQMLEQKLANPAARKLALIGSAKMTVERLAYDFETCGNQCAKVLPAEMTGLEKNLDDMRNLLGNNFSRNSYDMARNQIVFMKLAVDKRLKSTVASDPEQSNLIVAAGHLWELIDAVLDSYVEASGG